MNIANKVKKISEYLLEDVTTIKTDYVVRKGIKLTNEYNDSVTPISMLEESDKAILNILFKDKIDDFYYVEKI